MDNVPSACRGQTGSSDAGMSAMPAVEIVIRAMFLSLRAGARASSKGAKNKPAKGCLSRRCRRGCAQADAKSHTHVLLDSLLFRYFITLVPQETFFLMCLGHAVSRKPANLKQSSHDPQSARPAVPEAEEGEEFVAK